MNPLIQIQDYGQSIWVDYIRRDMLLSGELKQLIECDGIRGVTSNPDIFDRSISRGEEYKPALDALISEGKSAREIYESIACEDIMLAADLLRGVYEASEGRYGYVSLEVNPHLAYDPHGTVQEARRLWHALNRPNVMIKVPGTREGLFAVQGLISEGININVTLLFDLSRYVDVQEAYISGLERRVQKGGDIAHIHSVASFFVSRIDVEINSRLGKIAGQGGDHSEKARKLMGKIAVSCAKTAYVIYKDTFHKDRFQSLREKGAHPQQLLWASTGVKSPGDPDTKYVDALIGPETVNTMPMDTLNAYRDHGHPKPRLEKDLPLCMEYLSDLAQLGIDLEQVTQALEDAGVLRFSAPFDHLIQTLEKKITVDVQP